MIMITDNNENRDEKPDSDLLWWCRYFCDIGLKGETSLLKKAKVSVSVFFVWTARVMYNIITITRDENWL